MTNSRHVDEYPRFITPGFTPFDPLRVTEMTRKIVCRGDARKYTEFYCTGVYRGISTGYVVGCNLRCFYCWSSFSRDFPERYGEFYSAKQVFNILYANAKRAGVRKMRISGGEPTICWEHLMKLLELVDQTKFLFILETNGIVIGANKDYAYDLQRFKNIYVRVSLKAGYPEKFTERTGAKSEFFELPYKAIKYLKDAGIRFHVAAMTDPRIMDKKEREEIIKKLAKIDEWLALNLEEEVIDPYPSTIARLKLSGWDKVVRFR